jgi:hypothetical protein
VRAPSIPVEAPSDGGLASVLDPAGAGAQWLDAWLRRLVSSYLRDVNAARDAAKAEVDGGAVEKIARGVVRKACLKSALTGGLSGVITTGAQVATAETEGLAGLVTIPAAAISIGGEMVLRLLTHVRMICEIADLFGLRFDPDHPADVWALFALAFDLEDRPDQSADPGKRLVELARTGSRDLTKEVGARLLGESVARNLLPFAAVATSSVTNWLVTRKLGRTVRRYARYRRAFDEVLADPTLRPHIGQLVLGIWFVFTADGKLRPEETAILASLVRRCPPAFHEGLSARLADDIGWIEGLGAIPEDAREPFYHALEIGAAVDKFAGLRERTLLGHAARALEIDYDERELEEMIHAFERTGVLGGPRRARIRVGHAA